MLDRLKTRGEEGFTLIELLIAITVSGIILSALATGFIATMAGTQNMHDHFVESHDAQLLATYFPSDVQSADPTMINPDPADACGTPTSGTHVIRFQWQENDGTNLTVFSASYRQLGADLVRDHYSCTGLATETLATILTRPIHTSRVVAHDISDVQAPNPVIDKAHGKVGLTLYSHQTLGEQRASIPPYSYTFSATMRTKGIFAPFVVALAPAGTKTAGLSFNLTITAMTTTGVLDASYKDGKTIIFEGAPDSPTGVHPIFPTSVNFINGVGTAPVTLVRAGTTTLTLSQGSHVGPSPAINVVAGTAAGGTLDFSSCPPNRVQGATTPLQIIRTTRDASGNALPPGGAITVGVTSSPVSPVGATITPATVPISSGIAAGSFTSQNPGTSGTSIALTATSAPYSSATCEFTTTGTPGFSVAPPGDQTAGMPFDVTITKSDDGTNPDPDYNGAITVGFAGPGNAPDSAHPPVYPATVTFSGGKGKASITLFKALDNTVLTVSATGVNSGSSPAFKVRAKPVSALCILTPASACTGSTSVVAKSAAFDYQVGLVDPYQNPATATAAVTVTVTRTPGPGSGPSYSISPMVIPINGTVTPGTFRATADGGAKKTATFTATSTPALTAATIALETTT
jgi:prepilin-type N-terminal cleavage/methylation domain-containing protein